MKKSLLMLTLLRTVSLALMLIGMSAHAQQAEDGTIRQRNLTNTGQYLRGDGSLATFPTIPTVTPFNFSAPTARTLAVSTQYQAADPTKATITTVSPSCTNSSTLLAASACTIQVRQAAATVPLAHVSPVSMTWTSTVPLGLVFSQTSGSPMDVKVPIGGYFILCPTAGTFTISATEQTAG